MVLQEIADKLLQADAVICSFFDIATKVKDLFCKTASCMLLGFTPLSQLCTSTLGAICGFRVYLTTSILIADHILIKYRSLLLLILRLTNSQCSTCIMTYRFKAT